MSFVEVVKSGQLKVTSDHRVSNGECVVDDVCGLLKKHSLKMISHAVMEPDIIVNNGSKFNELVADKSEKVNSRVVFI